MDQQLVHEGLDRRLRGVRITPLDGLDDPGVAGERQLAVLGAFVDLAAHRLEYVVDGVRLRAQLSCLTTPPAERRRCRCACLPIIAAT